MEKIRLILVQVRTKLEMIPSQRLTSYARPVWWIDDLVVLVLLVDAVKHIAAKTIELIGRPSWRQSRRCSQDAGIGRGARKSLAE